MKPTLGIFAAVSLMALAAIPAVAFGQAAPSPPPKQGGDIIVRDSPNSVAAGSIDAVNTEELNVGRVDQMNVNMAPRRDAIGLQLAGSLRSFHRTMGDGLRQARDAAAYTFLMTPPPSGRARSRQEAVIYFFLVGSLDDDGFFARAERCEVERGVHATGYVASRGASGAHVTTRLMARSDRPVLEAICRGLRLPVTALADGGQTRGGGPDAFTVFDYLSRDSGALAIVLMPEQIMGSDFEDSLAHYWVPALQFRYSRIPSATELAADPALYGQMAAVESGDASAFQMPLPAGFGAPNEYPAAARQEFGDRLDRLDADWTGYLGQSALTLRGVQHPLTQEGRPVHYLPRFTFAQVGTPAFWRAARDVVIATGQYHCIATHFLIARGYVTPEELGDAGPCALGDIRLPAR